MLPTASAYYCADPPLLFYVLIISSGEKEKDMAIKKFLDFLGEAFSRPSEEYVSYGGTRIYFKSDDTEAREYVYAHIRYLAGAVKGSGFAYSTETGVSVQ